MSQCASCGGPLQPNATRCFKCGTSFAPVQPPPQQQQYVAPPPPQVVYVQQNVPRPAHISDKTRVAYIVLGLFLGGLGIHNFYAGRTTNGIIQLLITVCTGWLVFPLFIVGVWVLLEIITVTTDGSGRTFS